MRHNIKSHAFLYLHWCVTYLHYQEVFKFNRCTVYTHIKTWKPNAVFSWKRFQLSVVFNGDDVDYALMISFYYCHRLNEMREGKIENAQQNGNNCIISSSHLSACSSTEWNLVHTHSLRGTMWVPLLATCLLTMMSLIIVWDIVIKSEWLTLRYDSFEFLFQACQWLRSIINIFSLLKQVQVTFNVYSFKIALVMITYSMFSFAFEPPQHMIFKKKARCESIKNPSTLFAVQKCFGISLHAVIPDYHQY